jgi:hypothetical protein
MPSHVQSARVADGGLDAAIAWAPAADERLDLQLLWPEPLRAIAPATGATGAVKAAKARVLVDADLTSWDAWNQYAVDFAAGVGARVVHVDDGGITGPGFYDRCRRIGAPVLQSPKRHAAPLPAGLRDRAVSDPTPLWCWSLITRSDDDRPSVLALREDAMAVTRAAGLHVQPATTAWLPPHEPHRDAVAALPSR